MKTYFDQVAADLLEDPYFQKFKFRKRDSSLRQKIQHETLSIDIEHWNYWNIDMTIRPDYDIRFDVLNKWFEKFSFKTLAEQRVVFYVGFNGPMLGKQESFIFPYYETGEIYWTELKKMKDCIIECSEYVFEEYGTLEKSYRKVIQPILDGKKEVSRGGIDWFFEDLTLCRILHPENYGKLKSMYLKHANYRYSIQEPNMTKYYPRLEEILGYLENQDFKF